MNLTQTEINAGFTLKRTFGGKLSNFAHKQERDFEKKHLQAYIKGWKFFGKKFTENQVINHLGQTITIPVEKRPFAVKEIWIKVPPKSN